MCACLLACMCSSVCQFLCCACVCVYAWMCACMHACMCMCVPNVCDNGEKFPEYRTASNNVHLRTLHVESFSMDAVLLITSTKSTCYSSRPHHWHYDISVAVDYHSSLVHKSNSAQQQAFGDINEPWSTTSHLSLKPYLNKTHFKVSSI